MAAKFGNFDSSSGLVVSILETNPRNQSYEPIKAK